MEDLASMITQFLGSEEGMNQLRAVTEGEDALGEVTVRVSNEGITMLGKGVSTDIIEASCLAYLNAANRIIEARQEQEKAHQQETGV